MRGQHAVHGIHIVHAAVQGVRAAGVVAATEQSALRHCVGVWVGTQGWRSECLLTRSSLSSVLYISKALIVYQSHRPEQNPAADGCEEVDSTVCVCCGSATRIASTQVYNRL